MLQTTADKFKYALYCSSSAKLVQSHIVKIHVDRHEVMSISLTSRANESSPLSL